MRCSFLLSVCTMELMSDYIMNLRDRESTSILVHTVDMPVKCHFLPEGGLLAKAFSDLRVRLSGKRLIPFV